MESKQYSTTVNDCQQFQPDRERDNDRESDKDNDNDDRRHPSWEKRLTYAQTGKFDITLIQSIAENVKYHNEKIIKEVAEFYGEITLQ